MHLSAAIFGFGDLRPVVNKTDNRMVGTLYRKGFSTAMLPYARALGVKVTLLNDLAEKGVVVWEWESGHVNPSNASTLGTPRMSGLHSP